MPTGTAERRIVVDASVIVGLLVPVDPSRSDRLLGWLTSDDELWAPDLLWWEVGNVLRKLAAAGHLPGDRAGELVGLATDLPIVPVGAGPLLAGAWELGGSMSMYDAAYAALARHLDAPLLTLDQRLAAACRQAGIAVTDPAEG